MERNPKNSDSEVVFYRIGDISEQLAISPRTLRYYEELGFIVPRRSNGGFREYSSLEIEKLRSIIKLKRLGLSLEEIRSLVRMKNSIKKKRHIEELLENLQKKMREFEKKIEEYKEGIDDIKSLASFIEHSSNCNEEVELNKCRKCLAEKNKDVPPLIKVIL